jgi:hypothetical protein
MSINNPPDGGKKKRTEGGRCVGWGDWDTHRANTRLGHPPRKRADIQPKPLAVWGLQFPKSTAQAPNAILKHNFHGANFIWLHISTPSDAHFARDTHGPQNADKQPPINRQTEFKKHFFETAGSGAC